jgi:hypothetical protein
MSYFRNSFFVLLMSVDITTGALRKLLRLFYYIMTDVEHSNFRMIWVKWVKFSLFLSRYHEKEEIWSYKKLALGNFL